MLRALSPQCMRLSVALRVAHEELSALELCPHLTREDAADLERLRRKLIAIEKRVAALLVRIAASSSGALLGPRHSARAH